MAVRGHEPKILGPFKGKWARGEEDEVPLDHFSDCNNLRWIGESFTTRHGIGISQTVAVPLEDVVRIYNYPTLTANTQLVLTYDGTNGIIYHVVDAATVYQILGPIAGMEDFAFVPYAGRAYITPFKTFITGDLKIQKGLQSQFLYVYLGAGVAARKAAGNAPSGTVTISNGAAGLTDAGFKIFAVVFESDSGWLSPPAAFNTFTTAANLSVTFTNVPVGGVGQGIAKRHIVASKNIIDYNGNVEGYPLFFIPNATINDNSTTTLSNISFFDLDLLEDASHLLDNYAEIPAGAVLSIYHDRLALSTTFNDISLILVSAPGEPEAISQLTGLIIVTPDGNPITNHAELRDVFYVFKRARTLAFIDNDDEPSTWQDSNIDSGLGTCVHGIATVLDSGNNSVDFFIVCTFTGILLFNGSYILPELSWKIEADWKALDRNEFRKIQIINAVIQQCIYVVLPDGSILEGNYAQGMNPKGIRWTPITLHVTVNAIGIVNIDEIVIGADI